ncbi:MAG: tRNA (adenosine(37)-N6)-dimethylallyltransferase MiaA [Actinomycetaceae bacterium]|nr:tRNA (adenosine(37)-N6)-dimethylallyltransferase MiaA [Actinomycetaceae bacterium]
MLIGIVGATASGKSGLALAIARALRGRRVESEIISMDAFALYRGMDIGTAKPTKVELAEFAHHQVDVLDIDQEASVAKYQELARADADAIESRGHQPIAVGGSALYIRALFDKMQFPGTDPRVRAGVEARLDAEGPAVLYRELQRKDPKAAQSIHPNNTRRVVRALEVIELTGQPFSATLPRQEFARPSILIGVRRSDEDADYRIEMRTRAMLDAGFVEEVRTLMSAGLADTATASKATGYEPLMRHLRGEITLEEAAAEVSLQTRQLVRKQKKWFKRDDRIHWIEATGLTGQQMLDQALSIIDSQDALPE